MIKQVKTVKNRNRNDQMALNFQNLRWLDLLKLTTCLFFGGKEWGEDENMTKEGRPWKEEPCLYWFTNNDYANNEKLLVEARADLDPIWSKAGNYYNTAK